MELKIKKKESSILYKRSKSEKLIYAFVFTGFCIYTLTYLFAFFWLAINSLQDKTIYELNKLDGTILAFPSRLNWDNYTYAFSKLAYNGSNIFQMFFNSIWYTAACVGGSVFCSACTGYALSKYKFRSRNFIYAIIIFTMTVPVIGTTGAMFKLVNQIGIYNNPLYVVLKHLTGTGLSFLVMYGFFKNVSWSYAEAAFIDGAKHSQVFFLIMLPQALPAVATLIIIQGIGAWNEYMDVLLYLPDFPTVASGMYGISRTLPRLGFSTIYFAALVISMIPILILFLSFSNVIMKNFAIGGLKG